MNRKEFSLSFRFSLTIGVILLLFCAVISALLYSYLKHQVIKDAEEKTEIIVTHVKALGGYVKDTLRPKMFQILSETGTDDVFVIEAMSTTHVNLQVMKRFAGELPDYMYHRLSDRPLNPDNKTDELHEGLLRFFRQNKGEDSWRGIVNMKGRDYLVSARPVVSDASCLTCHGARQKAPRSIAAKYGAAGAFGWKAESVAGIESISIPLDVALSRIRKAAVHTFAFGSGLLVLLFLALYGTFRMQVTKPLNRLSRTFRGIAEGTETLGREIPIERLDEIGNVTQSFNILSHHLLDAQEKLRKTAEIEKQMMETEKLASLGQLSAGVAHEINNPLGGIKLCFNNLMTLHMEEAKKREHIEVINSGFDRIQNIVKGLLDFSKNSALLVAPASLNRIVEDVLQLAEYTIGRNKIQVVKELREEIQDLPVDANKLEQVLLNLIMNAVHAMAGGGQLLVRTWCDGEHCGFTVSDTGPGIPADLLNRIYDPFFSTKGVGEGTGLGLTVSKAIVEQHGGEILVETSGKGTTFTVRLPREHS